MNGLEEIIIKCVEENVTLNNRSDEGNLECRDVATKVRSILLTESATYLFVSCFILTGIGIYLWKQRSLHDSQVQPVRHIRTRSCKNITAPITTIAVLIHMMASATTVIIPVITYLTITSRLTLFTFYIFGK